jgi:hypothetical protein
MADKYLNRDLATGRVAEVEGTVVGGTNAQAGDILALDETGRIDPSVLPVGVGADVTVAPAGEALTAGDFVYIAADGSVNLAIADVGGFDAIGFVLDSVAAAAAATVYFEGRNTSLSGLTVGSRYYLSDVTPGGVTLTPVDGAGKRHQFLGKAITATSISFEADDGILLA